eukprot:179292_1
MASLFIFLIFVVVTQTKSADECAKEVGVHTIGVVFDLGEFLYANETAQKDLSEIFDVEMQKKGFILLSNHGVKEETIQSLYNATEAFFSNSDEVKMKYHLGVFGHPGYQPYGTQKNKLKNTDDYSTVYPDLVESFDLRNIGYKWFVTNPEWSALPAEFTQADALKTYVEQLDIVRSRIHYLATTALDLPSNEFEMKMISQPNQHTFGSVRINYYFALDSSSWHQNATRLGSHTDYLGFNILSADNACGLQFYVDGEWIGLQCDPHLFIVIAGDYIEHWTNHRWKAAEHRVVRCFGVDEKRRSISFFTGPNWEELRLPFPGCKKCAVDVTEHCKRKFEAAQPYNY